MENFFTKILFLTSISECGFLLVIFSERFHCQTGACKIDYCSAQQGASCCGRFGARLYVTS